MYFMGIYPWYQMNYTIQLVKIPTNEIKRNGDGEYRNKLNNDLGVELESE